MAGTESLDVLILGGGLTGSLTALALAAQRPDVRFLLVEKSRTFGGKEIAPFRKDLVPFAHKALIETSVTAIWPRYYVAFPGFVRCLSGSMALLSPQQLHAELSLTLAPVAYRTRCEGGALLAGGEVIRAKTVIDARGMKTEPTPASNADTLAVQTFATAEPHRLDRPVLADTTWLPGSSCHLVQCFPLTPHHLRLGLAFEAAEVSEDGLARQFRRYLDRRGWRMASPTGALCLQSLSPAGDSHSRARENGGILDPYFRREALTPSALPAEVLPTLDFVSFLIQQEQLKSNCVGARWREYRARQSIRLRQTDGSGSKGIRLFYGLPRHLREAVERQSIGWLQHRSIDREIRQMAGLMPVTLVASPRPQYGEREAAPAQLVSSSRWLLPSDPSKSMGDRPANSTVG
jgi:hypothetical protein